MHTNGLADTYINLNIAYMPFCVCGQSVSYDSNIRHTVHLWVSNMPRFLPAAKYMQQTTLFSTKALQNIIVYKMLEGL